MSKFKIYHFEVCQDSYDVKKVGIQQSLSIKNNEVKCDHILVIVILLLASKSSIVVEQLTNNPMLQILKIAKSFTQQKVSLSKSVILLNVVLPCMTATFTTNMLSNK
jgi:hypothetical protein